MVNENGLSGIPEALSDDWVEEPFNPDSTPNTEETTTNPSDSGDPTSNLITIARDKLGEELERLFSTDSDFAREFSTRVGNKARERYYPQVEEWKSKYEDLIKRQNVEQVRSVPEADLAEKLKDPNFARQYAEAQTYQPPEQPQLNPAQELLNFWINEAMTKGFTEEDILTIQRNIGEGRYEKDEFGIPLTSPTEWREGMKVLKRDIDSILASKGQQTPPQETTNTPPPTPPVSQQRDTSGPDISNPGSRGGRATFTWEQYQAMNVDQRMKLWPTQADEDAAIARGEIKLPDFS